ncbi:alpha/beta hydrolase family protein [Idiomarina sp. A28L]|uniref:alpha/beta hydrolase n=1 Tax=Idiomarina sp. A28L TaxID=1036674 RepID=UPI0002138684|nr:alpha/beta hydrolase [Idiomarina sp. A28L]EGN74788.1 alpha/beta hydrolase family protein [Idiomarina sp. A28L]
MPSLFFFHGLESGPHGSKYQLIKKAFPELESPDFQDMDLHQRLAKAAEVTQGLTGVTLIGSSFGGLLAARLYSLYPERFKSLVLLAPAVHTDEGEQVTELPPASRIRVIHGKSDEVVPHAKVAEFCKRFGISLITVEDEHRLASETSQQTMLAALDEVYSGV